MSTIRRVTASVTAVGVTMLAAAGALLASPVAAQADPAAEEKPGKLLLMLDASGSMKAKDPSGLTKIAAAKKALTSVVGALPADAQVGLRVYGATQPGVASGVKPPAKACTDTQLVAPIKALDKPGLTKAINGFAAKGETPIAYSLTEAMKDLGSTGKRNIVLVSDGEESCVPDPCPVITKLVGTGIDLQIDTVGFGVNAKARKQLQCIATAGKGTYYDAQNSDQLTASLTKLSQRALRPFTVDGTPVKATADPAGAPELAPGRYTDTYAVDAKPRYYTVKRTPGSVVHLALVARPEASSTRSGTDPEKWQLTLATPDGQECDSDVAADIEFFRSGSSQTVAVSANNTNAGTLDSTPGDRDKACADSPTLVAAVLHDKGAGSNRVQLVYLEEPPVTNLDSLPDGVEPDQVKPLVAKASSSPTPVAGGGGFGDAPTLEPGSYTETVVPGEQLYYKVRLDFGQRAAFTTDVNYDGAGPRFDSVQGLLFTVDAWTPALYRLTRAGGTPDNRENINSTAPKVSLTEYTPEVRYRNKAAFGNGYHYPALRQVSIPGYYYFAIGSERDDDPNLQTPVNVRINVAVEGQPTGEPEYAAGAPAVVTGTSSPSETATASATSSPSTGTDATAAAQETGSEAGVPVWVWIVGGLVVLAAAAGVTLGAMRRGSNAGSHQ